MTKTATCTYQADRDRAIIDYLYGEGDPATRASFDWHLGSCAVCRAEVTALGGVRQALADWAPPEPMRALDHDLGTGAQAIAPAPVPSRWAALHDAPLWARAAAAVLCIGLGAGAANLRVTYGPEGVAVQTGWLQPAATPEPAVVTAAEQPPWREELTAFREQMAAELEKVKTAPVAAAPSDPGGEALVRQIRSLVAQSEQRQQRELALRIGDLLNDVQAQRRADLSKIDRSIGLIQNSTGMEVLRQREMLNSLAVRVSTQRP